MKLPLPTYRRPGRISELIEAISVFVNKIDEAIETLMADGVEFHGKNHMIQLIMCRAGMFMCEESFKDIETYLGENLDALLRDYGVRS